MRAATIWRGLGVALLLAGLVVPLASQASAELAVEMGCVNCHGTPARAGAPSLDHLAAKLQRRAGDAAALRHVVQELRQGEWPHAIAAHERLSQDSAERLVRWLAEGAPGWR